MTAITDDNPVANLRFFTFLSLAKTISFKISCSCCPISILYLCEKGWSVNHAGGLAQKKSEEICGPDYESKFSPKPFDD